MSKKKIHEGSWAKSIFKTGKWYIFGSLFSKGMLFFLLPIYTSYLTPEEYGIFNNLNSFAVLLPIIISLSLDSAFGRFFHDYYGIDDQKLSELFSTIYWFVFFFGSISTILFLFSTFFWMEELLKVAIYPYALLAFIPPLLSQLGSLGMNFLSQSLNSRLASLLGISSAILNNLLISLPLLVIWDLGVIGRLWGGVGAAILTFTFSTIYFYKKKILRFTFNPKILKESLYYSIPLIPMLASSWIAGLSDRLVITNYVGNSATGLYSLAFNIAMLLYVVQDSITRVTNPMTMSGFVNDKIRVKEKIKHFSLVLLVVMLLANLGLFLFSKEIVLLFAEKSYADAFVMIPIIGFIYVIGAQTRFFSTIISFYKKTWILTLASMFQAVINLGFNLIFVPLYGYIAAPIATVVATSAYGIFIFFWSQSMDKVQLEWKKSIQSFFLYSFFVFGVYYYLFPLELSISLFLLKILIFIVVSCILITIGNYWKPILDFVQRTIKQQNS